MNHTGTPSASTRLIEQATMLLEACKEDSARLHRQMADATARIESAAERLRGGGERFGRDALRVIDAGSRNAMADSAALAIDPLRQQADAALQGLQKAARAAAEQLAHLRAAQSALVWKSLAALGLGAVFVVGGTSWWAWSSYQAAQHYRIEADIARRMAEADIVRCGDGLCANVDAKAPATGERRQYLMVRPRIR